PGAALGGEQLAHPGGDLVGGPRVVGEFLPDGVGGGGGDPVGQAVAGEVGSVVGGGCDVDAAADPGAGDGVVRELLVFEEQFAQGGGGGNGVDGVVGAFDPDAARGVVADGGDPEQSRLPVGAEQCDGLVDDGAFVEVGGDLGV